MRKIAKEGRFTGSNVYDNFDTKHPLETSDKHYWSFLRFLCGFVQRVSLLLKLQYR